MTDLGCYPLDHQNQLSVDSSTDKERESPVTRILRHNDNVNNSNVENRHQRCNSTPRREKYDSFDRLSIGQNSSTPKYNSHSAFGSHDNSNAFSTPSNRSYMSGGSQKNNSTPNILTLGDFFPDAIKTPQSTKRRTTPINEINQTNNRRKNVLNNSTNKSYEQNRSSTTEHTKPKRRVVPTTISRSPSNQYDNIVSSSFKSENNLVNLMAAQPELPSNTNIERQLLINEKKRVTQDFVDLEIPIHELNARLRNDCNLALKLEDSSTRKRGTIEYDATKVTNESILDRLVDIYSVIINQNLTQNFLTDIAFLINLLNADDPSLADKTSTVLGKLQRSRSISSNEQSELSLLINRQPNYYHVLHNNIHNCIYFAFGTLKRLQHFLVLLDATSIKVLLDNERLITSSEIVALLADVYALKIRLEMKRANQLTTPIKLENNIKRVMYQQDNDTRRYFSSDNEFAAFRRQRDGFYEILRLWEQKHIVPKFNFNNDLAKNVQNLMNIMQHPVNMAHLAKLFTSQLIISCNFDDTTANELQIALPGIDINKLTKLQQRLIAPGDFSTEFLFPGNQAFFRDFITSSSSYVFLEQLKICLISELTDMNKMSTFDEQQMFNINQENEFNESNKNSYEIIVRPEIITTMRILAKFTGFIIDYSNCYDGNRNPDVDDHQIILRNFVNPIFDIKLILIDSIKDQRLVITIPWIVQYLAMLDSVTLRLNYYNELFEILYTIYIELNLKQLTNNKNNKNNCNHFNYMRPTSIFIIKLCLGWLFDLPNVPDQFYKHLQKLSNQQINDDNNNLLKSLINSYINNRKVNIKLNINNDNDNNCDNLDSEKNLILDSINKSLDPILEGVMTAACPFLADFRVAIMPQRTSKTVSRTGRYRHITTKLTTVSIINNKHNNSNNIIDKSNINNNQLRLIESFLQSQSLSTRRTVDFIIERVTSAVIKDFQMEHLLLIKAETKCCIKNSKSPINNTKLLNIYKNGLKIIEKKWFEVIPKMIKKRVEDAFEALLPNEMLKSVKKMCIFIAMTRCRLKTTDWRLSHLNNYDIFDKNFYSNNNNSNKNDEAISHCNSSTNCNKTINDQQSTIIRIDLQNTTTIPSNLLYRLQDLLHISSMLSHQLDINKIQNYCDEFLLCINEHELLSSAFYRNIAFMLLHLSLLLVENRPELLTDDLIERLLSIWKHKKLIEFTMPIDNEINKTTPTRIAMLRINTDESLIEKKCEKKQSQRILTRPYIFYDLLNQRLITLLQKKTTNSFNRLAKLLSKLIMDKLFNIDLFNQQFITLFNCVWPEHTLKMLSYLFKTVSSIIDKELFSNEQKQSYLYIDMLSDLASNMKEF